MLPKFSHSETLLKLTDQPSINSNDMWAIHDLPHLRHIEAARGLAKSVSSFQVQILSSHLPICLHHNRNVNIHVCLGIKWGQ